MKNLGQMMKQAQEMQTKMQEMQEKLADIELSGTSGAGMVTVTLNGKAEMRRVKIDPSLFNSNEAEVVEDLIVAAFADAKKKQITMGSTGKGATSWQYCALLNNMFGTKFKLITGY